MTPTEEFEQAQELVKQGRYEDARKLLAKYPDNEVAVKLLTRIDSALLQERIRRRARRESQNQNSLSLKWSILFIIGLLCVALIALALFFPKSPYAQPQNEIALTLTVIPTLSTELGVSLAGTEASFQSQLTQLNGISAIWLAHVRYNNEGLPLVYAEIRVDRDSDMGRLATDIKDMSASILGTNQFTGFALLLDDSITYAIYTFDFVSNTWQVEPMEAFSATRAVVATQTYVARPTRTPRPTPTRVSISSSCTCNQGNTLNCSNFSSQRDAQICHNSCFVQTGYDVHNLDSNGDGVACE